MMKNTFNAMLKNRPKENDEQNVIDLYWRNIRVFLTV